MAPSVLKTVRNRCENMEISATQMSETVPRTMESQRIMPSEV